MNHRNGFTMIEVLITVAIIGILAAIAIPAYTGYINSAKCTPVEAAVHDTMLGLTRDFADSGTAPPAAGFANTHTLPSGTTLTYDTNVQVSYSGSGTQANPFIVNGKRSNPACNKGDGTYTLTQNQAQGVW